MIQSAEKQQKMADGGMTIPCKSSAFIRNWLEVMRPVHKLSKKEMDIAAALINYRFELAKSISDQSLIDKVLFSKETKEVIIQRENITADHFKMILHKLRENKVIIGKTVNPRYLPDFVPGKPFRWLFIFQNEN